MATSQPASEETNFSKCERSLQKKAVKQFVYNILSKIVNIKFLIKLLEKLEGC